MNEESRRTVEIRRNSTWAQDRSDAQRRRGSEALAPCSVTKNVKVIFEEFKSLYEERLKRLKTGTEGCTQEEMLQKKVRILQSYVNDLCDQNQLLVQTVEDLEKESTERITSLERELRISDKTITDLNHQRRCLEESLDRLQTENLELKTDVDTLAQVVRQARQTHSLDVTGVKLHCMSQDRIIQSATIDHGEQEYVMNPLPDELVDLLKARIGIMHNLQEEIKMLSDTTTAKRNEEKTDALAMPRGRVESLEKLQAEKVAEIADRDVIVARLQKQLRLVQQDGVDMQNQLQKSKELTHRQREEIQSLREKRDTSTTEVKLTDKGQLKKRLEKHKRKDEEGEEEEEVADEVAQLSAQLQQFQAELEKTRSHHVPATRQARGQLAWERGALLEDHWGKAEEREEHRKQMREELAVLKEKQEASRLERAVQEQAQALGQLQQRHQESVEENGRLQARLEAQTITAQSQEEALNTEIRNTEDTLHKLQKQLADRENVTERALQKILTLEQDLEKTQGRYSAASRELQGQCDLVGALEKELERTGAAQKEAAHEVSDREERLLHLQLELTTLRTSQEHTRRALAVKEQLHAQLSQENRVVRENMSSLQNQLQASEGKVNSLGLEVGTLKSKLQEKSEQSQQLQDQILKQQEALSRAGETLKDTRKAAGNKIQRKDNKLNTLQKELEEFKKQLSDYKNEHEATIQRLEEDTAELMAQLQQRSRDLTSLSAEKSRLELELVLITEKHHTAQHEVSCRDQVTLHMKTDLRAIEERHQGTQEELVALEAEVSRLNEVMNRQREQLGEAEQSCRQAHLRLQQEQQEKQRTHAHLHNTQLQLNSQAEFLSAVRSELEALKQTHCADEQRWSQKSSLLQGQLDETRSQLRETSAQASQQRHALKKLKSQANQAQTQLQHAQDKVKEEEERVRTLKGDLTSLRQQHEGLQQRLEGFMADTLNQEATAAILRQKYTVAMEKVQQLQEQLQASEEEMCYSRKQVLEAQEVISGLREENSSLEARGEEKRRQVENAEEAIDHLTEELQAALDMLTASREHASDRDRTVVKLHADLDDRQAKIVDYEKKCLQLQSDITTYLLSHSHPNDHYEAQRRQRDLYQKEVTLLRHQYEEHAQRSVENDNLLAQLHEEAQGLRAELHHRAQERQELERAVQSLQLELASAQRERRAALSQLQQETLELQQELSLARNTSTHKDQAVKQRDELLRQAEVDLQQAQETVLAGSQEAEGLRAELQSAQQETCSQQQEKQALSTHISRLSQQLQQAQGLYRGMAQALAGQEERVDLLESGLRSAEERLGERVAHSVRLEHSGHKSHNQLSHMQEMVVRLQGEAAVAQSSLQQALGEAMQQQRQQHTLSLEREQDTQEIHTLTQQLQQQAGQVCSLRLELQRERAQCQDHQQELARLNASVTHLNTQVESLRVQRDNHANIVRRHEGCMSALGQQLQQCQAVCQENSRALERKEEQLTVLRAEAAALQQGFGCKAEEQSEALKQEQQALEKKLEAATSELQRLGEALAEAQAENSQLSQESQLVLTNVSHWIKEQKRASENLSVTVKEQSQRMTILTAERDHLQASRDALEAELKTLRAASAERERELEHLKAIHSHSDHQQALLSQLQGQLKVGEIEKENLVTNNLNKLSDMQDKLRSNMDSILHLNQQLCTLSAERDEQHTQLVRERGRRKQMELQLLKGTGTDTDTNRHPHPPPPSLQNHQRSLSHNALHLPSSSTLCCPADLEVEGRRDPGGARLWRSRSAQRLEDPWTLLTGKPLIRSVPTGPTLRDQTQSEPDHDLAPHFTLGQGQISTKVTTCQ
ncbi:trichohyalin-like isoform X2 [Clupea harengus]|uniref:Trichohyalin-like isoform X2 n=1 Tax=Clupea harengus TaxID=7950 RepID=A0A6P8GV51_CLUHA|nr:trichohyalin-like isoform X2 [Clupea harengus]